MFFMYSCLKCWRIMRKDCVHIPWWHPCKSQPAFSKSQQANTKVSRRSSDKGLRVQVGLWKTNPTHKTRWTYVHVWVRSVLLTSKTRWTYVYVWVRCVLLTSSLWPPRFLRHNKRKFRKTCSWSHGKTRSRRCTKKLCPHNPGDTHANIIRLLANLSGHIRKSAGDRPGKSAMLTTLKFARTIIHQLSILTGSYHKREVVRSKSQVTDEQNMFIQRHTWSPYYVGQYSTSNQWTSNDFQVISILTTITEAGIGCPWFGHNSPMSNRDDRMEAR